MRKLNAIFLVLLLSWPLLVKVGILVSWQVNEEYIAQNLCVNRDKPKNQCHGACHLAKQLSKTDERQEPYSSPLRALAKTDVAPFLPVAETGDQGMPVSYDFGQAYMPAEERCLPGCNGSVFHPPRV